MLGRILLAALVLGLAATVVPVGDVSPVDGAAAYCIYVQEVDQCVNPCSSAATLLTRAGVPHDLTCPE